MESSSAASEKLREQNIKVCGDHGVVERNNCVCEAGWVGEHCQYKTKCKTNDDCNGDKVTKSMSQSRKAPQT